MANMIHSPVLSHHTKSRAARYTIDDVAKLAGVSRATVSRVLNGSAAVSPETAEAVRRAVADTGYVPNLIAGGLASNRSRLVAAMVPSIATSIFNGMIEAMIDAFAENGYQMVLGVAREGEDRVKSVITSMLSRRPEAIILTWNEHNPALRRLLTGSDVTVIETWDLTPDPLDVAVGFSHFEVGKAMAKLAVDKGYRSPLVISAGYERARMRLRGMTSMFESNGVREILTDVTPTMSLVNGRERFASQLETGKKPDIVLCSSDLVAQGVLIEAAKRGMRIPDDLAVFGFGDMEFAAHSYPPLTTVRIDGRKIAQEATRIIVARMQGRLIRKRVVDVGFSIVERESV